MLSTEITLTKDVSIENQLNIFNIFNIFNM